MNEKISVKVVVFEHPEPQKWGKYCGYCASIKYECGHSTIQEVIADIQSHLLKLLCHRFIYKNLENYGWCIDEDSVVSPIFADKEIIALTEQLYEVKIVEPKIIEVNVETPIVPVSE
ncbi:MAG: hypothetical protein K2O69_00945 [Odoribacter sp.]|nr:hypothetical protein [Odoribacter sp.]